MGICNAKLYYDSPIVMVPIEIPIPVYTFASVQEPVPIYTFVQPVYVT